MSMVSAQELFGQKVIFYEGSDIPQGTCSSPVQLTVCHSSRLLLNVTNNGTMHTIRGWLKRDGIGVSGQTIKIQINQTSYFNTTGAGGLFILRKDLKPINNNVTTYMVTVSYNGTTAINATAWTRMLDGTSYASCTTTYIGIKPSANSTILTVDPVATMMNMQNKTPEQIQQETEQSGALTVYHEFSWWYPWYRIHIDIDVNPKLFYSLDLFGFGNLDFEGLEYASGVDEEIAGYGALTEAAVLTGVSTFILLWQEKITASIIGGITLFGATMAAMAATNAYSHDAFVSFTRGIGLVLSVFLYATAVKQSKPLLSWVIDAIRLWLDLSSAPAIATAVLAMVGYTSVAIQMIWPPIVRSILFIATSLCIELIWIWGFLT
jgi:hypothetical protein